MSYDGVIFSSSSYGFMAKSAFCYRGLGPYRIRTVMAERGYRVKVIDFAEWISKRDLARLIELYVSPGCQFLGLSTTFMSYPQLKYILDKDLVALARRKAGGSLSIIAGGANCQAMPHAAINWYVSGYADLAFPALMDFLNQKTSTVKFKTIEGRKVIDCNHDYPVKDTENLTTVWLKEDVIRPWEALPIEISRGCIFRCAFCSYPLNGKKKFDYIRGTENLLAEIRRNYQEFGVTNYGFMDDTYNDSEFKMDLMHKALKSLEFKIRFSTYIKPELLATWPHHAEMLAESGLLGATFGLESFHPKARASIRKGPDIEKIFRAVERLRTAEGGRVGTAGTFIVGLPHEDEASIMKTHEWLKANTHLINTVNWYPLTLTKKNSYSYQSEMDMNPEKYGYTITNSSSNPVDWKNEYMDFKRAVELKEFLSADYRPVSRVGGWAAMTLSHFKNIDVAEMVIQGKRLAEFVDADQLYGQRARYMREYLTVQLSGAGQELRVPTLKEAAN